MGLRFRRSIHRPQEKLAMQCLGSETPHAPGSGRRRRGSADRKFRRRGRFCVRAVHMVNGKTGTTAVERAQIRKPAGKTWATMSIVLSPANCFCNSPIIAAENRAPRNCAWTASLTCEAAGPAPLSQVQEAEHVKPAKIPKQGSFAFAANGECCRALQVRAGISASDQRIYGHGLVQPCFLTRVLSSGWFFTARNCKKQIPHSRNRGGMTARMRAKRMTNQKLPFNFKRPQP